MCLSVCLSLTSRHCTKTAKRKIMQTTPYDSPGTLVFLCQRRRRNSDGVTPTGVPNRLWFSTNISLYLRNDARYGHSYYGMLIGTRMCSIEGRCFQWPWMTLTTPKPSHFRHFVSPFMSSYCMEIEISNSVRGLKVASASPWMANYPWNGRGYVTWSIKIFVGTNRISGTADRLRCCQLWRTISLVNWWPSTCTALRARGTASRGSVSGTYMYLYVIIRERKTRSRGTARRAMLVNLCCVLQGMGVRKISHSKSDLQWHWQWCHSIDHIRFHIRLPLQPCLYVAPFPRYYHLFPKTWRGHVSLNTSPFGGNLSFMH